MDWLRERPFAHRGLHDAARAENSLDAVAAAAEAGYGIELDVRLAEDRTPVLAHDEPQGGEPTLAEALAAAAGAPLLVELKERAAAAPALEQLRGYSGRAAVVSFDPLALRGVQRPCGQIVGKRRGLLAALLSRPDFLLVEQRLVRPRRVPVLAWTIRSDEEERRVRAAGAANIVFEGFHPAHSAA